MLKPVPAAATLPAIRICDSGISLAGCDSIEIVLLQWHSASPFDKANGWRGIDDEEAARKLSVLERLRDELSSRTIVTPLFVVAPELSLPRSAIGLVEEVIAAHNDAPVVFIAGLERVSGGDFEVLEKLGFDFGELQPPTTRRLNLAAIWIRSRDGTVRRYLQAKRSLSDDEQQEFVEGHEALVFTSPSQISTSRLNFAIGICSDFTNDERVLLFRRAIAEREIGTLDLLFLLQMNEDQRKLQFRTAVRAFYRPFTELSPADALVDTERCTLVFINNASADVNRSEFGESAFYFRYTQLLGVKPNNTQPTILIDEQGDLDYRAAVFRENRESIYWIEFVPLHRVLTMPGSGERHPFRRALHADLAFPLGVLRFQELPAVIHWLLGVWQADEGRVRADALQNFAASGEKKEVAVSSWMAAWRAAIEWWRAKLGADDNLARRLLALLNPLISGEPRRWRPDYVIHMLRAFILFTEGKPRNVDIASEPCAQVTIDKRLIAFRSGEGTQTWRRVARDYYRQHRTRIDALGLNPLLVIQDVAGNPPISEYCDLPDIATIDLAGSITAPPRLAAIQCTSTGEMYDALCESPDWQDGIAGVAVRADEVLQ